MSWYIPPLSLSLFLFGITALKRIIIERLASEPYFLNYYDNNGNNNENNSQIKIISLSYELSLKAKKQADARCTSVQQSS